MVGKKGDGGLVGGRGRKEDKGDAGRGKKNEKSSKGAPKGESSRAGAKEGPPQGRERERDFFGKHNPSEAEAPLKNTRQQQIEQRFRYIQRKPGAPPLKKESWREDPSFAHIRWEEGRGWVGHGENLPRVEKNTRTQRRPRTLRDIGVFI